MALYIQFFREADIAAHPDRLYAFCDNEAGDPDVSGDNSLAGFRRHPNTIQIFTRAACPVGRMKGFDSIDQLDEGCWSDDTLDTNVAKIQEGFGQVEAALARDEDVVLHFSTVREGASFQKAPQTCAAFMKSIDRLYALAPSEGIPMLERTRDIDEDDEPEVPCP